MTKEQAQKIDTILDHLVNDPTLKELNPVKLASIDSLEYDEAYELIQEIIRIKFSDDVIVKFTTSKGMDFPVIWPNPNTKRFLNAGGCIALLRKERKAKRTTLLIKIIIPIIIAIITALAFFWDIVKEFFF